MATDVFWVAKYCWNNCECCIFEERKTLHWALRGLRNCTRPNKSKRWKMDCTAADNWAQTWKSRRTSTNWIIRGESSTKARNPPSCLVSSQKPTSRSNPKKHSHWRSSIPGRRPFAWWFVELQLQDTEVCCLAGTRRFMHWSWHAKF